MGFAITLNNKDKTITYGEKRQTDLVSTLSDSQGLNYIWNSKSLTSLQKLNLGLFYNTVPTGFTAGAQYNGNISAMAWNTPLQTGALSPADKQGYGFTYDGLNRMLTSTYGEGTTFATNAGVNNENVTYDLNGNIKTLTRYLKGTGLIDNLTYTYKDGNVSNTLDRVDDAVTGSQGFSESVKQANEYGYDVNGNLTSDANKGYTSILYNYLNLPRRIGTASQYISYLYDAAGTKLAKIGTANDTTYYAGSFIYSGSSLNYILHREGMYLPGGNYQYFLKDHLGNTRLVVNTVGTGGTIVQQTDYYPFGMDIASYNGGLDNKYRYNGKEFQNDVINGKSLQWYDYGARFYDPLLGRWSTPDVLRELRYEESPFCYVGNNPISRVDPDGRIWDTILDAAFTLYDAGEAAYQYATTGAVSTTTKAALAADALAIIIPGVTGAGIGVRMAAHAEDAVRAADKAVDAVKALDKVSDGAKAVGKTEKLQESAKVGQEAHRQMQKELREQGAKTEVNVTLKDGSTVRKDAVRPDGTKVIIKPDTPSGRRSATAREAKMQDNGHKTEKIFYDPKDPKYLPNSSSYIGPQR